jgi:hypothetical protein
MALPVFSICILLNGRRVKTVDVHVHCAVPEAMALIGMTVSPEILHPTGQTRVPLYDDHTPEYTVLPNYGKTSDARRRTP